MFKMPLKWGLITYKEKMVNDSRYRNFCFTSYEKIDKIDWAKCGINYCIYQREKCPSTGKLHWQGYVEFDKKISFANVKELFNNFKMHLEPRFGTQRQAIEYCKKKDSRYISDEKPFEFGFPKNQGRRTDLDEIWEDIQDGMTTREILMRQGAGAIRHINHVRRSLQVFHRLDMLDATILRLREDNTLNDTTEPVSIVRASLEAKMKKSEADLDDILDA